MSSITTAAISTDIALQRLQAPDTQPTPRVGRSARSLAALLLSAAVAGTVVIADRVIQTWADQHLFVAWVMIWAVVFAGLALFAGTARQLAQRTLRALDAWSRLLAESRAQARLWDMAQSDPRLKHELQQAFQRDTADFDDALAPLGMEPGTTPVARGGWGRFPERLAESRARNIHLYYI